MTRSVEFLLSFSVVRGFTRVDTMGGVLIKGAVAGGGLGGGVVECGAEGVEGGGEACGVVLEELGAFVVVGSFPGSAVVLEDFCVECSSFLGALVGGVLVVGGFGCCEAHVWGFVSG